MQHELEPPNKYLTAGPDIVCLSVCLSVFRSRQAMPPPHKMHQRSESSKVNHAYSIEAYFHSCLPAGRKQPRDFEILLLSLLDENYLFP
jgi:hypothetical protein